MRKTGIQAPEEFIDRANPVGVLFTLTVAFGLEDEDDPIVDLTQDFWENLTDAARAFFSGACEWICR